MAKILIAPGKYMQGANVLAEAGPHIAALGKKALVLGDPLGMAAAKEALTAGLKTAGVESVEVAFGGECCRKEISRVATIATEKQCSVIIGVGGGKTLDTAKATAYEKKIPIVIVPTIASTDAPCSALAVIYTETGAFESYLVLPKNPDAVIVDTCIVAKAPVRLFISGMGDALATYFEADACSKAFKKNMPGGLATRSALALARLCYDTLIESGLHAMLAVEKGIASPAVEDVVEANTLLSGLGFESGGLAAAHAIHNGLTVLEETHHKFHGEKVAFGTLVQLVLENRSREEIEEVLSFCAEVGLPMTLAAIGIVDPTEEKIRRVAEAACAPDDTIHNEPFPVTADSVYAAIFAADALGRAYAGDY